MLLPTRLSIFDPDAFNYNNGSETAFWDSKARERCGRVSETEWDREQDKDRGRERERDREERRRY